MNKLSMILTAVVLGGMVVFYAPQIFALNRGHILRNIALWLAIFAGLALIYQNFGPASPHPLFSTPMSRMGEEAPAPIAAPVGKVDQAKPMEEQSFTPPKED